MSCRSLSMVLIALVCGLAAGILIRPSQVPVERSPIPVERLQVQVDRLQLSVERLQASLEPLRVLVNRLQAPVEPPSLEIELVDVVVATVDCPRGQKVTKEMVFSQKWPNYCWHK